MKANLTRRHFIRTHLAAALTAATFPSFVSASAFGKEGVAAPSNRINVGCIGVGPQGRGDMGGFLAQADVRVVAVCDVAKRNLDAALEQVNQKYQDTSCKSYLDFQELLDRKDIDAV